MNTLIIALSTFQFACIAAFIAVGISLCIDYVKFKTA